MGKQTDEFRIRYQDVLAPNALGYRLKLLSQTIERRFQEVLNPFGLTPLHWGILCCLWQEDGLPTLQIGKQLQQLNGTVAVALPLMEKQGYIQRRRDQNDRRILRIWLTPKGAELKATLPQLAQNLAKNIFSDLSQEELAHFSETVDRLHRSLEARLDTEI
jgi:DNA-binding MarR family transcriptional regulator